jgi:hypothetical protein
MRNVGMRLIVWMLLATGPAIAGAYGATLHVDQFESDNALGWTGGQDAPPTAQSSGGPTGAGDGYLRVTSGGDNLATYNVGASWTGNLAAIGAAQIKVDMMSPSTSAALQMRIVLFGPTSPFERWTSVKPQAVLNDGVWRSYTFSLAQPDMVRVLGSDTYAQVMAGTSRVMLRHDPDPPSSAGTPVNGILNLDNLQLAPAGPTIGPADFDGNGWVDALDLAAWTTGFGTSGNAMKSQGDANGDSNVDGSDFLVWQQQLAVSPVHSVPEPLAIWLSLAAILSVSKGRLPHRRPAYSAP